MIFGVLNPEKNWHQHIVHLPTSPAYCSHVTLGNPKSHFSTVLFIHTSDYDVISEENKLLLPYPPHLKNVAPLPCKNCTNSSSISFFHAYRVPIRYTDELRNGSVLLRHGLNFSRAWWMIQLISGKKDWKHVSVQKMVTLNICVNVACHIPFATHHNRFFSEPPMFGGMQHTFSQMKKLCILQVTFLGVVGKGVTVCFVLR